MNFENILSRTRDAVAEVAGFVRAEAQAGRGSRVDLKSLNNLVTDTDRESERRLVAGLAGILPGCGFLTEEGTTRQTDGDYRWIIDPIDGTTNFVHGIPAYAISVGLWHKGRVVLGVVHEINLNEQFCAAEGHGAWLNGNRIKVTETAALTDTVLATGFPYDDFDREEAYWLALREFTHKTRGIRRLGSAAVDLCYVACGRFDGFFEYSLSPWDVAGGAVIVREAGGKVSDFSGGDDWLFGREIAATNGAVHADCLEVIRRHF